MSEHTKTPWEHCGINGVHKRVSSHYATCVATTVGDDREANARHIVHCVNNFTELVEALVNVKAGLEAKLVGSPEFTLESMIEGVSRALAALEAEKWGEL